MTATKLRANIAFWKLREARIKRGLARNKAGTEGRRVWAARKVKADRGLARNQKLLADKTRPMRLKAYDQAVKLIGVMEHGGNNAGAQVSQFIRDAGGSGPEPWCGDFMYAVYRRAGSERITKAVGRLMAYVPWISRVTGLRVIPKSQWRKVERGDIVRYEFTGDSVDDHTGMFDEWIVPGQSFYAIEGNTGSSGAVSDSTTGGDGVYRKVRNMNLVSDFVRVDK